MEKVLFELNGKWVEGFLTGKVQSTDFITATAYQILYQGPLIPLRIWVEPDRIVPVNN
jgi:hypothetical protein